MPVLPRMRSQQLPGPNVNESLEEGFAHCVNARCDGYGQEPVMVVRTVVEHTVGSRGGDGIFSNVVENTNEYLRLADEADIPCPSCSKDRDVSLQERPVYPIITGFPQDGLLNVKGFDPNVRNVQADEAMAAEVADLRRELAELRKAG